MAQSKVGLFGFTAALSVMAWGAAQAEMQPRKVADRPVATNGSPEQVFKEIEKAATAMCSQAARTDRVVNEVHCVNTLIAYALSEAGRPSLTAVAVAQRPAIAMVKISSSRNKRPVQTSSLGQ
jgi:Mg-chelatase subunit ChlI